MFGWSFSFTEFLFSLSVTAPLGDCCEAKVLLPLLSRLLLSIAETSKLNFILETSSTIAFCSLASSSMSDYFLLLSTFRCDYFCFSSLTKSLISGLCGDILRVTPSTITSCLFLNIQTGQALTVYWNSTGSSTCLGISICVESQEVDCLQWSLVTVSFLFYKKQMMVRLDVKMSTS